MAKNYHVLEFPLQKHLPPVEIDYLPFGTRVLKIRFTNPDRIPGSLVVRSKHIPSDFNEKSFFSFEDQTSNFRVSWGGGHQEGACISGRDVEKKVVGLKFKLPFEECGPLEPSSTRAAVTPQSFVYLNVTHLSGDFNQTYPLTLVVKEEGNPSAPALFTLPVLLKPPKTTNPVHLVKTTPGLMVFQGSEIPRYLSRWWSPWKINYSQPPIPDLSIEIEKEDLFIWIDAQGKKKKLVHYHDEVKFQDIGEGHQLDADLYHLVDHFFVIRLWFFWVRKIGAKSWTHEIPDAERFDFVIDAHGNRVRYVATDTHWRECWAPGPRKDEPVLAQIGLFAPEVLVGASREDQKNTRTYLDWMKKHSFGGEVGGITDPYNPIDEVLMQLLNPPAVLGVGIEAHVPYFTNCPPPEGEDFIASDPRFG